MDSKSKKAKIPWWMWVEMMCKSDSSSQSTYASGPQLWTWAGFLASTLTKIPLRNNFETSLLTALATGISCVALQMQCESNKPHDVAFLTSSCSPSRQITRQFPLQFYRNSFSNFKTIVYIKRMARIKSHLSCNFFIWIIFFSHSILVCGDVRWFFDKKMKTPLPSNT